jgi:hypothetical protein
MAVIDATDNVTVAAGTTKLYGNSLTVQGTLTVEGQVYVGESDIFRPTKEAFGQKDIVKRADGRLI